MSVYLFNGFGLEAGDFSIHWIIQRDPRVRVTGDKKKTNAYISTNGNNNDLRFEKCQ